MNKGKLSVQVENILPIIKKWLYSEKEIFLRELVSNSFDAINKLKKVSLTEQIRQPEDQDYAINIVIDREKGALVFEDNGIGMTSEEIVQYLANVAFSSAHDFMRKYESAKREGEAGIIGNFGLGFYSVFMVADRVEVESLSYRLNAQPVIWKNDGGAEYELAPGSRTRRGTSISLFLSQESKEYLDKAKVDSLVRRFVDFLPLPVHVDGAKVNRQAPLWSKTPSSLKREDYNEFYRYLYPFQGDPLFYVHLNVDYPFQLQGILFFPRLAHEMDLNKSSVKIYCKQVFVSDEAQELIPKYLTALQGVIDIPDLPLNVSRSYLQNEPQIKKIATHIIKKVADRLKEEHSRNRSDYRKIWPEIAPFVKYAMLSDDRFYDQARSALIFQVAGKQSNDGDDFTTLEEYSVAQKEKVDSKIFYVSDPKGQASPLAMLQEQGIDAILLNTLIDSHFIQFLEGKGEGYRFVRVDAEISDHILERESDFQLLDAAGQDRKQELIALFREALGNDKVTLRVEALKNEKMPAMILLPEQMRRIQEISTMMNPGSASSELSHFPLEHTLILNSRNSIIQKLARPALISSSEGASSDRSRLMASQIYYLARLSQGSVGSREIEQVLDISHRLLEYSSKA